MSLGTNSLYALYALLRLIVIIINIFIALEYPIKVNWVNRVKYIERIVVKLNVNWLIMQEYYEKA